MNWKRRHNNKTTSLRNPLAAMANVTDRMAEGETETLNWIQRYCEAARLRELAGKEPPVDHRGNIPQEMSARGALFMDVNKASEQELRAAIVKLQKVAKANGPNDPSLS